MPGRTQPGHLSEQLLDCRRLREGLLWLWLSMALGLAPASAWADQHILEASLAEAKVTFTIPAQIKVGEEHQLVVKVAPTKGHPAPAKVRARLGMPGHGHWITDESGHPYASGELPYPGKFPMAGKYRFRVWLDFEGGTQKRTAVDFEVSSDRAMAPKVVK